MRLAQTLAGNWVITVANPEEPGWETQLAEFATTATGEGSVARMGLEFAAVSAVKALLDAMPTATVRITSHDSDAVERLRVYAAEVGVAAHRVE